MNIIKVKRLPPDNFDRPRVQNIDTKEIYADVSLGNGEWYTTSKNLGEPDTPLKDFEFQLFEPPPNDDEINKAILLLKSKGFRIASSGIPNEYYIHKHIIKTQDGYPREQFSISKKKEARITNAIESYRSYIDPTTLKWVKYK